MDAVSDHDIHTVVVMSSAQVGKTEIVNNLVGFHIHQDPAPILVLQPTLEMAQTWSKDRLAPMLRDTPALRGKVKQPRSKSSTNTLLHKVFPGGHITMAGSNSPASLASRPIRVVLCDEVDRYPASAGTEGDPVNLAKKRTATFWNRTVILTSTPTIKGVSRIEAEFEESDQRYFFVPCPHCGEHQRLKWSGVTWAKDEAGESLPETAQYACEHCGALWTEVERHQAVKRGEWRATKQSAGRAGFHLSELYSPWSTLESVVRSFLEAKKSPELQKTWENTCLGETYEESGDGIDETGLYGRREEYPAPVPADGLLLTAGVDIQRDRIEVEVVAWGEGEESWNVDYIVLPGDTARDPKDKNPGNVWRELDDVLFENTYEHETGTGLHITATVIDSSDQTTTVYEYVKSRQPRRVFAAKGIAGPGRPIAKKSGKQKGKKTRDVDLYQIGVDDAKNIIYSRLKIDSPGPGYCHFPRARDEEYFAQLTAEKLVTRYHKGFPRKEWIKARQRNEALDCRVYALAALKILNPVWSAIERRLTGKPEPKKEPEQRKTTQRRRPVRRKRNWATDF